MSAHSSARIDLDERGFAVIEGAFSQADVAHVRSVLDELFATMTREAPDGGRFIADMAPGGDPVSAEGSGVQWRQPELRYAASFRPELLDTRMFRICHDIARSLAGPVSRSFDHVIRKPAYADVGTAWHQDGAYRRFSWQRSAARLHFWIPLQDATVDNGCMQFVPGSHRVRRKHRSLARASGPGGVTAEPTDADVVLACPVASGGLTIHTPLTLHAAGPNRTGAPRTAWIIQFAPLGGLQLAVRRLLGDAPR